MNTVRTLTLRPPRARKRTRWALLLFVALALGSATAGLLNQQSGRPGRTTAPQVVVTVTPSPAGPSDAPVPSGTPTAPVVDPTLPAPPLSPLGPLGPLAPTAAVTVLPPTTHPGPGVPSAAPTRPSGPPPTASPTRTPTRSPSPTPTPTSSPTPLIATPRVAAVATGSSYRSGAYVRGKVVVSGLPSGYADDATLQLHGPFPSSAEIDCATSSVVRTDTIHVTGDGTWSGPTKAINRRGFYVWEALLPAGPSSHAASSSCPTRSGRFEVTW